MCPVTPKILYRMWFIKFPVVYRQEMNSINIFEIITSTSFSNQFPFDQYYQKDVNSNLTLTAHEPNLPDNYLVVPKVQVYPRSLTS